jgi:anti-sigma B factor antagonist
MSIQHASDRRPSAQRMSYRLFFTPPLDAPLTLTVTRSDPVTQVRVSGVIDMSTRQLLDEFVEHLIDGGPPADIIMDLSEVRLLAAAGISALLRAQRSIAAASGRLILRDPSPLTSRVLDITGSTQLFDIEVTAGRRLAG